MIDKWIPVSVRLPKFPSHGSEFLVASSTGYVTSLMWNGDRWYSHSKDLIGNYWAEYITHWMPLPEHPDRVKE